MEKEETSEKSRERVWKEIDTNERRWEILGGGVAGRVGGGLRRGREVSDRGKGERKPPNGFFA